MGNENGTWIMYGVEWDDPECLHTVQDAINYINEIGFLPLFKNSIPGFSLEERTVPESIWGYENVTSRYNENPLDSGKAIAQHIRELYPIAKDTMNLHSIC